MELYQDTRCKLVARKVVRKVVACVLVFKGVFCQNYRENQLVSSENNLTVNLKEKNLERFTNLRVILALLFGFWNFGILGHWNIGTLE